MDEISMFPHNVPLPDPKPAAWIIGGAMHVTNLFVRISQSRQVAEEEMPWADLYSESRGTSWFDWVSVFSLIYLQHGKVLTRFYSDYACYDSALRSFLLQCFSSSLAKSRLLPPSQDNSRQLTTCMFR